MVHYIIEYRNFKTIVNINYGYFFVFFKIMEINSNNITYVTLYYIRVKNISKMFLKCWAIYWNWEF